MLPVSIITVCYLIDKARAFHAKEEVVFPERPLSYTDDWAMQVLADHHDDRVYCEFEAAVSDLEPDQKVALVALMWIGRGDFEVSEWDEAVTIAEEQRTQSTAHYLLTTPLVSDYLEEGLSQFGYSCSN